MFENIDNLTLEEKIALFSRPLGTTIPEGLHYEEPVSCYAEANVMDYWGYNPDR